MNRLLLLGSALLSVLAGCGGGGSSSGGADTEAPTVAITSHASVDTFTGSYTVTLSGTASDNTAVDTLTVSVNGGSATALNLSGGSFSSDLTFTGITNTVVVTATDAAGNSSTATTTLHYVATGLLDTSFNSVGYNTFESGGNSHDSAEAVVIATDGSFYIAGYARNVTGTGYDIAVWHLLADGTADTGFDGDGLAILAGPAGGTGHDFGKGIAIDSNGKIVVAGFSTNAAGNTDVVVARFNTDGTLDNTFGGDVNPANGTPDGFVVVDTSGAGSLDEGNAMVLDSSDNIYVAGTTNAAGTNDMALWKFTSAGALDTSFAGGPGYLSYGTGGADAAYDVAIDGNGKLLVTGAAGGMAIWRVTAAGVSDTAFNGTGVAVDTGGTGKSIAIDADGNILVAGDMVVTGNLNDMALWRYTSAGVLDTSFAAPNGYVTHDGAGINHSNDYDYGYGVAIDAAGNILVTGSTVSTISGSVRRDMVVWRFTSAGVLDTTFGDDVDPADLVPDGYFTHNAAAGANSDDQGKAIAIDVLGRPVIVGDSINVSNNSDMAIWRLY